MQDSLKQFDISAVVGRELECCKQLINTVECEEHLHESLTTSVTKEYVATNTEGNGVTPVREREREREGEREQNSRSLSLTG